MADRLSQFKIDAGVDFLAVLRLSPSTPCALADAAAQGDEIVLKVLHEAGQHLGFALANIINVADVHFVVLGGDLASLADYLLPSLRESFSNNVLPIVGSEVKFLISALGRDAVAFGGIALAMDGFLPLLPNDIWRSSPTGRTDRQNWRIALEQKNRPSP